MKSENVLLVDHLNKLTWIAMSSADVNKQNTSVEVVTCLEELVDAGYKIKMGSSEYNYTIGELRAIEKLIAWSTQIYYAENLIQREIDLEGENAELEIWDEMITDAEKGLLEYQDIHPDGIPFFIIEGDCVILKFSPYFYFEERIMYKTGLIISQKGGDEEVFV